MNAIIALIPRLFSLRVVVLVLAAVFAFAGDQFALVGWADRALFSILGVPEGDTPAAILTPEALGPAMADRDILIVDDVMTSGATLAAATEAAFAAGARDVRIATLARVARDA